MKKRFISLFVCISLLLGCFAIPNSAYSLPGLGKIQDGTYIIVSAIDENMAVDISGQNKENGVNIHLWERHGGNTQKFKISKNGEYYKIINVGTGKAMDIVGSKSNSGANVHQWDVLDVASQNWEIEVVAGGYVKIKSSLGHYLDAKDGKAENGTNVQMYKKNGTYAQKWFLVKCPDANNGSTAAERAKNDLIALYESEISDTARLYMMMPEFMETNKFEMYASAIKQAISSAVDFLLEPFTSAYNGYDVVENLDEEADEKAAIIFANVLNDTEAEFFSSFNSSVKHANNFTKIAKTAVTLAGEFADSKNTANEKKEVAEGFADALVNECPDMVTKTEAKNLAKKITDSKFLENFENTLDFVDFCGNMLMYSSVYYTDIQICKEYMDRLKPDSFLYQKLAIMVERLDREYEAFILDEYILEECIKKTEGVFWKEFAKMLEASKSPTIAHVRKVLKIIDVANVFVFDYIIQAPSYSSENLYLALVNYRNMFDNSLMGVERINELKTTYTPESAIEFAKDFLVIENLSIEILESSKSFAKYNSKYGSEFVDQQIEKCESIKEKIKSYVKIIESDEDVNTSVVDGTNNTYNAKYTSTSNFNKNYTLTGNPAEDIAKIAYAQIGRTTSQMGYTNAWCAYFVSDCARLSGISTSVIGNYSFAAPGGYGIGEEQRIEKKDLKNGDLVFWYCTKDKMWWHVGIYYNGKVISGNNGSPGTVKWYEDKYYSDGNGHGASYMDVRYYRPNYSGVSKAVYDTSISDGKYYLNNDGYYMNMLVDKQQRNSINASNASKNTNMEFTFTKDGNYYKIVPTHTANKLVLNAFWNNNKYTANGDEITLYSNTDDPSQRWYFEECGNGYLIHPGDAPQLSLTRDTSTNKIFARTTTKAANQIWELKEINEIPKPGKSTLVTNKDTYEVGENIVCSWENVENGTYFEFFAVNADENKRCYENWGINGTSHTISIDKPGNYYIYVVAINQDLVNLKLGSDLYATASNHVYITVKEKSHSHTYTTKYELEHPHKEYKICDCGVTEYTGKTSKVASCKECYPDEVKPSVNNSSDLIIDFSKYSVSNSAHEYTRYKDSNFTVSLNSMNGTLDVNVKQNGDNKHFDPSIIFPNLKFDANDYKYVIVNAKVEIDTSKIVGMQVFFTTKKEDKLSESKSQWSWYTPSQETGYRDFVFDMSEMKTWSGGITSIRIDPFNDFEGKCFIKSIRFTNSMPGQENNDVTDKDGVTVTIPKFKVIINGELKDNSYAKYPYISYNDITYFPMTYKGARFLGLECNWTADSGLVIKKNPLVKSNMNDNETQSSANYEGYTAQLATGKININGKAIDNSAEQYPVLIFRDVTYFPLTWRFAVTEFGWEYRFTMTEGLVINSK